MKENRAAKDGRPTLEHGDTCEWIVSDGVLQSPKRCEKEAEYVGVKNYATGTVSVLLCESHSHCVTDEPRIEVHEAKSSRRTSHDRRE